MFDTQSINFPFDSFTLRDQFQDWHTVLFTENKQKKKYYVLTVSVLHGEYWPYMMVWLVSDKEEINNIFVIFMVHLRVFKSQLQNTYSPIHISEIKRSFLLCLVFGVLAKASYCFLLTFLICFFFLYYTW